MISSDSTASLPPGAPLRVAVTGASGFLATALASALAADGIAVVRVGRAHPDSRPDVVWDPVHGRLDAAALEGVDAVVNLAGESIAERWTDDKKRRIRDSRVKGTELLARTLPRLRRRPAVWLNASAVGYYGDRGGELLDERAAPGHDFLAQVVRDWEAATRPAEDAGIRVVHTRSGVVLDARGGLLAQVLRPFKLGVGGRLGDGEQYMGWIALEDWVRAVRFALATEALRGPVNVVAPQAVTNAQFTRALGRVLRRPTLVPVPETALFLAFGEMGRAIVMSQRTVPRRLLDAGFTFRHPDLADALRVAVRH